MTPAAVVLCGGRSRRMGRDKARLPFGDTTFLGTVVATLRTVASPVIVVAAGGQELPTLPAGVEIARDCVTDDGPLRGLAAGLAALTGRADVAFLAACDLPLLTPAFVAAVTNALGDAAVAVPFFKERLHPLSAAYRVDVLPTVERLLNAGHRRLLDLFDAVSVRRVPANELPDVRSLRNVNRPEDYAELLRDTGGHGTLEMPPGEHP